ncbi:glycosyltransferase family 2 protein [Algoriphagus sediminis]|uniref:Glycosyltransferase family A protein n=1 Tax=Algoriphagus sediminis TaxID=3057113 RepID=A0ABT7YDZ6_9BACT|nr:glycosyltransferase family A protein [Algoriphagus sediminis]MDN3204718.1 glycosyltransferase family A protein [Algoriphagus sediminis]
MPLVSILIPNYNKLGFIEDTFQSLLAQTFQDWECIVVDDHSDDGSFEYLEELSERESRIKLFKRPDHLPKGGNICRNFAFEKSSGELIQWFDSDDIMLPNFLEDKVEFLKENPEFAFVVSKVQIHFEEDYQGEKNFEHSMESENPIPDYLNFKLLFLPGGPMFRRKVFEEVGLFNPSLRKHQEWELFFRAVLKYPEWGIIHDEGYIYQINNDSITARMDQRDKLVEAEIHAIQTALSYSTNPQIALAPAKVRQEFLLRYLRFSLIHKKGSKAYWFLSEYLKGIFR